MTRDNYIDFLGNLRADARILGLDVGSKTIGLSVGALKERVATPLRTIQRRKFMLDVDEVKKQVALLGASGLVIGLPLDQNGEIGPKAQSVKDFAFEMKRQWKECPPFVFWDERFSTQAMTDFLIREMDVTRKRRAEVIDKMAAQHILQGFLDYAAP